MQGIKNEKSTPKRLVISSRVIDPFADMIFKNNKSPLLKPVYVKSKFRTMKSYRSHDNISNHNLFLNRDSLPPISPNFRPTQFFDFEHNERQILKTPNFKFSGKKHKNINFNNITEPTQLDLSFGDIE